MIFGWFYPKKCVGCQALGKYFCEECLRKVQVDDVWRCPECNLRSIGGGVHLNCKRAGCLDGVVSLLPYKGLIGAGIRNFKYKFLKDIGKDFYKIMVGELKRKLKSGQALELINFLKLRPVIVPVPLHWRKENYRGFNQAEITGEMIAEVFGLEMEVDFLFRKRLTKSQAKLNKKERKENLKMAFAIRGARVIENVLLVDDVWTTGETMKAAGRTLKFGGVKRVWGLTLAR